MIRAARAALRRAYALSPNRKRADHRQYRQQRRQCVSCAVTRFSPHLQDYCLINRTSTSCGSASPAQTSAAFIKAMGIGQQACKALSPAHFTTGFSGNGVSATAKASAPQAFWTKAQTFGQALSTLAESAPSFSLTLSFAVNPHIPGHTLNSADCMAWPPPRLVRHDRRRLGVLFENTAALQLIPITQAGTKQIFDGRSPAQKRLTT